MTSTRKLCCFVTGNLHIGDIMVPSPMVTFDVTLFMAILMIFMITFGGRESKDAILHIVCLFHEKESDTFTWCPLLMLDQFSLSSVRVSLPLSQ